MRLFPLHIIKRDDGQPYLKRWTLFNFFGLFKIRLHHILLSDYDCVHDHPWWFITWIIKGGYWEYEPVEQFEKRCGIASAHYWMIINQVPTYRGRWSLLYRPSTFKHRIALQEIFDGKRGLIGNIMDGPKLKTAWTLVIMGRSKRLWGFWTKMGFIPWFNYQSTQKCD